MVRNKTAKPVSVELCEYAQDARGQYMSMSTVTLCVTGDCVSKSYKGNLIKSLNPPVAWGGAFHSVIYCKETGITTIEYWFEPSNCILSYRRRARFFAKRMQRRINRLKLKNMKELHENIK